MSVGYHHSQSSARCCTYTGKASRCTRVITLGQDRALDMAKSGCNSLIRETSLHWIVYSQTQYTLRGVRAEWNHQSSIHSVIEEIIPYDDLPARLKLNSNCLELLVQIASVG